MRLGPHERVGEQRAGEVAPDLARGVALEDQPRPQPHDTDLGVLGLEHVEQLLDLGLVARVERGLDPAGRPALVDRAVLRARRVGADRGRVDQSRHARRGGRRRTRAGCRPRWWRAASPRRATAGSATPGARRRRRRGKRLEHVARDVRPRPLDLRQRQRRRPPRDPEHRVDRGSSASALSTLVPALPLAPTTTTLMARPSRAARRGQTRQRGESAIGSATKSGRTSGVTSTEIVAVAGELGERPTTDRSSRGCAGCGRLRTLAREPRWAQKDRADAS